MPKRRRSAIGIKRKPRPRKSRSKMGRQPRKVRKREGDLHLWLYTVVDIPVTRGHCGAHARDDPVAAAA